jgi:hypothetical protein
MRKLPTSCNLQRATDLALKLTTPNPLELSYHAGNKKIGQNMQIAATESNN